MSTILDNAMQKYIDDNMENEEFVACVSIYTSRMNKGFYSKWWVDSIVQKWDRLPGFSIYDAYPFAQIHAEAGFGKILCARVGIGIEPFSDKDIEQNNSSLKKLWSPFSGEFWGGNQGHDGFINIDEFIEFDGKNMQTGERVISKFKGNFPLEVGTTSAVKSYYSLCVDTGPRRLARWPYGSKDIILMAHIDGPLSV